MDTTRLRLKLQNGMELEAEGDKIFVQTQKEAFLQLAAISDTNAKPYTNNTTNASQHINTQWSKLTDAGNGIPFLKAKNPQLTAASAALLILAAWTETVSKSPMEALKLAKAMKKSGYIKGRLDRLLTDEIARKLILPSGTKRARNYALSAEGLAKSAAMAANL